jgi:hypothetical protein
VVKSVARSFFAILVGWLAGAAIATGLTYLLYLTGKKLAPQEFLISDPEAGMPVPGPIWLFFLLGIGAAASLASGCVVSLLSQSRPSRRGFILAILMTAGAIGVTTGETALPAWFSIGLILSTPVCVLVGTTLQCRLMRGETC